MIDLKDLNFFYPEDLVATEPRRPSRVLWNQGDFREEISVPQLLERIPAGDVFVVNTTRVLKRRVFSEDSVEILFLSELAQNEWSVLFPARETRMGSELLLPDGVVATLIEKGLPQKLRVSRQLDSSYFEKFGELPLPPYIQNARDDRHTRGADETWYQTAWAKHFGSLAAPTASLHFSEADRKYLQSKGVEVLEMVLHVGLGTFLPIKTQKLSDHRMHSESVEISAFTWQQILKARKAGRGVWALGTTVARALESAPLEKLIVRENGDWSGTTDLFIHNDFEWQIVTRLLTNFHQPHSTLLALVASFAGLENVRAAYEWAVSKRFRLFSYGDLSVWLR